MAFGGKIESFQRSSKVTHRRASVPVLRNIAFLIFSNLIGKKYYSFNFYY